MGAVGEEGRPRKLTIIAWSGDMDKVYPVLILATVAAASGWEVVVFVTFWGLFAFKRNDRWITGKDWMTKMLSLMFRGGSEHLGLTRLNMAGMGPWMMKKVFAKNQIPPLRELIETAVEMGVKIMPCQMTMDALGIKREDLIDGLGESAGAAAALEEAATSDVTLFI